MVRLPASRVLPSAQAAASPPVLLTSRRAVISPPNGLCCHVTPGAIPTRIVFAVAAAATLYAAPASARYQGGDMSGGPDFSQPLLTVHLIPASYWGHYGFGFGGQNAVTIFRRFEA